MVGYSNDLRKTDKCMMSLLAKYIVSLSNISMNVPDTSLLYKPTSKDIKKSDFSEIYNLYPMEIRFLGIT